jgi:hypothetical protein
MDSAMRQENQERGQSGAVREIVRRNATSSLLEAAVMLVVGFGFFKPPGLGPGAEPAQYAVAVVIWTFRGGGVLMLGIALLAYSGWPRTPLLDSITSIVIGLLLVVSGGVWLMAGDTTALLIVLFGLMSLYAARGGWGAYGAVTAAMGTSPPPVESSPARSSEGARTAEQDAGPSIGREKQGEAPPEGFLAELGNAKDEQETPS